MVVIGMVIRNYIWRYGFGPTEGLDFIKRVVMVAGVYGVLVYQSVCNGLEAMIYQCLSFSVGRDISNHLSSRISSPLQRAQRRARSCALVPLRRSVHGALPPFQIRPSLIHVII